MHAWGTFSELATGQLRMLLASNPSCETNPEWKPGFKARMLHCSCCMHIQLHSGVNSIHSHESLSYIVQAVAAIATDFLTPVI